jgi:selenocysteine lyase/cysteine desulfurase
VSEDELEKLVDDKTAVISMSHVEYGSGQRYDLRWLSDLAHKHGAILVLDASQSAGIVPIDVRRDGVDVLVTTSYKGLLGPFGAGILCVSGELCKELEPSLAGWRSTDVPYDLDSARLEFANAARKFEFGTMSYSSAFGLAESMRYLRELGYSSVSERILLLSKEFLSSLAENQGTLPSHSILTSDDQQHHSSIISLRFRDLSNSELVRRLATRKVVVSERFSGIRFSFHIYNTEDDIATAIDSMRQAAA